MSISNRAKFIIINVTTLVEMTTKEKNLDLYLMF